MTKDELSNIGGFMPTDGIFHITIKIPASKYRNWQLFLKEKYNIEPAGRYSEIMNKNAEVFIKAIEKEMQLKKD
jgi:hypothetical protein